MTNIIIGALIGAVAFRVAFIFTAAFVKAVSVEAADNETAGMLNAAILGALVGLLL